MGKPSDVIRSPHNSMFNRQVLQAAFPVTATPESLGMGRGDWRFVGQGRERQRRYTQPSGL